LTFELTRSRTVRDVSTYTIGEVARRSGFSTSTLRYYEGIGLVAPATRTRAGYRVYDDGTLGRLAFIARAKQLGCSLDEIAELVEVWDGEHCAPVQHRLHDLVTEKLKAARAQIGELAAFSEQLQATAAQLAEEPVDGPCAADCACVTLPAVAAVPIACTLAPEARPERRSAWDEMLASAARRSPMASGGHRIEFDEVSVTELVRLVEAEQKCCAFFSFAVTVDTRGVALEVRAPEGADHILAGLLGSPA